MEVVGVGWRWGGFILFTFYLEHLFNYFIQHFFILYYFYFTYYLCFLTFLYHCVPGMVLRTCETTQVYVLFLYYFVILLVRLVMSQGQQGWEKRIEKITALRVPFNQLHVSSLYIYFTNSSSPSPRLPFIWTPRLSLGHDRGPSTFNTSLWEFWSRDL